MPIYSAVMMMLPTAAPQEILGESVKQILNAIPNNHLVGFNKRTTFNDYHQTNNYSDNSSALILPLQVAEVAIAICQDKKAFVEKRWSRKNDFCKQMVSLHSRFPRTRKSALNNLPPQLEQ